MSDDVGSSKRGGSPNPIVVGVDGSEGSRRALAWCREHAPALGAEVVAVHGFSTPYLFTSYGAPEVAVDMDAWQKEAQRAFETEWTEELADVAHRTVFVAAPAARALLDTADDVDAGMIVVGSRGRGGFAELVLGSVSHHVTHHSRRPVLIVPAD